MKQRTPECSCHPSAELRLLQSMTRSGRPRFRGMLRGASREVRGSSSTTYPSSPLFPGLPHPVRSVSRVSHPPDGFLLDGLPGLVSCRERSWSSCPSELFPRAEPSHLSMGGAFLPLATAERTRRPAGSAPRRCSPGRVRGVTDDPEIDGELVALLGFGSPPGLTHLDRARCFHRAPPASFLLVATGDGPEAGTGRRGRLLGVSAGPGLAEVQVASAALVGFSHLVDVLTIEERSSPGS